jgi:hypothetical protein
MELKNQKLYLVKAGRGCFCLYEISGREFCLGEIITYYDLAKAILCNYCYEIAIYGINNKPASVVVNGLADLIFSDCKIDVRSKLAYGRNLSDYKICGVTIEEYLKKYHGLKRSETI